MVMLVPKKQTLGNVRAGLLAEADVY